MIFKDFVLEEFKNFNNFVERKYVLSETAFTRKGKLSLESIIKYPLCNRKKTTSIEVNRFLRNELNDRGVTITKQAISEKRQFIDPIVYIDMNDNFISKIYAHQEEMASFKGFHVCAIDSSIVEIPNTKITRKEFGIPEKTQLMKDTSTARISCMVDTQLDFVLSSNLTNKKVSESPGRPAPPLCVRHQRHNAAIWRFQCYRPALQAGHNPGSRQAERPYYRS